MLRSDPYAKPSSGPRKLLFWKHTPVAKPAIVPLGPPQQHEPAPALEPAVAIPDPIPDPPIQQKVEEPEPVAPQPEIHQPTTNTMSFKSILNKLGHEIVTVFQFADKAATLAEPFVAIANPALGALMNYTLIAVQQAEALGEAAAASANTGPAKAASVISSITPVVTSTLVSLGVPASAVNSKTVTAYVNAFVALLNTLPAPPDTAK